MSLSVADANAVFTKSIASGSDSGVTASCIRQKFSSQLKLLVKREEKRKIKGIKEGQLSKNSQKIHNTPVQVIEGGWEILAGCPGKA